MRKGLFYFEGYENAKGGEPGRLRTLCVCLWHFDEILSGGKKNWQVTRNGVEDLENAFPRISDPSPPR